jgi:hypothetical protein
MKFTAAAVTVCFYSGYSLFIYFLFVFFLQPAMGAPLAELLQKKNKPNKNPKKKERERERGRSKARAPVEAKRK